MSLDKILGKDVQEAQRHVPIIEAPERVKAGKSFEVKIRVGEKPHPYTFPHHIFSILVFVEVENRPPLLILRYDPFPPLVEPRFTFFLSLDTTSVLHVVASCNVHGVWEGEKRIEVI